MKTNKKVLQIVSVIALFLAVVGISVGFAMMSTTLEIAGTAKVIPATWDIKFTNYSFSDNDTDASQGTTPTMTDTTFTGYQVVLTKPADKGTYLVTVTNNGSIDAKVSTVTLGNNLTMTGADADKTILNGKINYNVTWEDGSAIAADDELLHGQSKNIKIEVEYSSLADELPSGEVTIGGRDLTVVFVQK